MSLRILQFGVTGQVATELLRQAAAAGVAITALSRAEANFADPDACAKAVRAHAPDLVIIAAAYTAVDLAEQQAQAAIQINAVTPAAIAGACAAVGCALVHFSTDYVFDGAKGAPYTEDDAPGPLNVYGASKLAGGRAVLSACRRTLVLRTSWVISAHGKNFVKTILKLARDGQPLRIVADQFGRPTAAADLAGFVLAQAPRLAGAQAGDPAFGLFHFANAGETSWHSLAEATVGLALGDAAPKVQAIPASERPAPARRPARATLATGKLERVFACQPRAWRDPLAEIVAEL